jgi:hypothetical protein
LYSIQQSGIQENRFRLFFWILMEARGNVYKYPGIDDRTRPSRILRMMVTVAG